LRHKPFGSSDTAKCLWPGLNGGVFVNDQRLENR
jgi:hypothetical protein